VSSQSSSLPTRPLGRTGMEITTAGLGCWAMVLRMGPCGPTRHREWLTRLPRPRLAAPGRLGLGDLDMPEADWVARQLAARGIGVVSVFYRLAPPQDFAARLGFAEGWRERNARGRPSS